MHIGIILPNLGKHQLAFQTILSVNELINKQTAHTVALFQQDVVRPIVAPQTGVFDIINIADFTGVLVATTVDTSMAMKKSTSTARKLFYVWDLEWTRQTHNYLSIVQAYHGVDLIARSMEHANAIQGFCNKRVSAIIPDVNVAGIIEWLENET